MKTGRWAVRWSLLLAGVVFGLLVATPALAMHPEDWNTQNPDNPNPPCNENTPEGYSLHLPSGPTDPEGGEAWECVYGDDIGDYYWRPVPPDTTPYDVTGWIDFTWADPGAQPGVSSFLIQGYNEWIDNSYRAGYFVSVDNALTSPGIPADELGVYQGLYYWDSTTSTWDACNNTGWEFGGGTENIINLTNTAEYAAGTCGYNWYNVLTWIEVWNSTTGSWDLSAVADPSTSAGQNVGYASYGANGMVYDPAGGGLMGQLGWLGSPLPPPTRGTETATSRAAQTPIAPPPVTSLNPAGVANAVRNHADGITPVRAIGAAVR